MEQGSETGKGEANKECIIKKWSLFCPGTQGESVKHALELSQLRSEGLEYLSPKFPLPLVDSRNINILAFTACPVGMLSHPLKPENTSRAL